ncbi:ATP-dependent DNA helicase RecG [Winkia sp. UMB0889B]|uniref:ATP-dependent DNA helicase RecG n=1 Tax=Winkia sp. UMB0889B TaxID=3046315 RepID=UPI002555EC47|nr:ATP-dependent DNA helicase RecG [Winkia sp. UMB0889B]MDK7905184.1 ATP-dependent DNA helicase RecG [Winkia sp. UMB0889B]
MTVTAQTPLNRIFADALVKKFVKLNIETAGQVLAHFPFRYQHKGELRAMATLEVGADVTVYGKVISALSRKARSGRAILNVQVTDGTSTIGLTFFGRHVRALSGHQRRLKEGATGFFSGKVSVYRNQLQLTYPSYVLDDDEQLAAFDQETPIPIYHTTAKLKNEQIIEAVKMILGTIDPASYPDLIPPGSHTPFVRFEAIKKLHLPATDSDVEAATEQMRYEEAMLTQTALLQMRAKSRAGKAPKCARHRGGLREKLEQSLPFTLTEGQRNALKQIDKDMGQGVAMSRLVQGDVGSGKTIVALLAMVTAVENSYQAALLAPTEILAEQHYASLRSTLGTLAEDELVGPAGGGVPVFLLTGNMKTARKREVLARLASSEPAIVVGTHALLSEGVQLPYLGLAVVDEQHRFGVEQRDKIRASALTSPHMLVTTATPIPRTLAMTVFGDLDVTTIKELPKGRKPVQTFVVPKQNSVWMERLWQRSREEINKGGRVFVVCPSIESDDEIASVTQTIADLGQNPSLKDIPAASLHGKMSGPKKDAVMVSFTAGKVGLLVSTTVIEVGVDVPDATMMVILDADRFGLSQLHQLRGRVGRGNKAAVCMAVTGAQPQSLAGQRLEAFASTTDGFKLSEYDLSLRSSGNVLGAAQSGATSSLKFLDVIKDTDVIEEARSNAKVLIESDPTLAKYPNLAAAIKAQLENMAFLEKN